MKDIWFRRKTYGWGWTPANLKGWTATVVYMLVAIASSLLGPHSPTAFVIAIAILTIGFIVLCYKKGESPKWSWGRDKKKN